MIERLRASVSAFLQRASAPRTRSPRARRIALLIAAGVFVVAVVLAVRNLPPVPAGDRRPWLFPFVFLVAVAGIAVNGAEYVLSARALGRRVPIREATRVTVLSSAANLLPIPGAVIVKMRALQRGGARLRVAAALTMAIGLVWLAIGGLLAGVLLAASGEQVVFGVTLIACGAAVLALGGIVFGTQTTQMPTAQLMLCAIVIEIVSVTLTSVRFFLVLRAVGFEGSFAQAATLATTAIVASAAGVFPGGLGLREALSSLTGPAVGLSAAVSAVIAAVERVVSLAALGVMTLIIVIIDRTAAPAATSTTETAAPSSDGATCA